ncbi:MAG: 1-deoxy-D-xylulose-5-phosphate reductoisomerase [Oscillospiraceae bacterium]|jgi:1-deoxy-D-xylulose-5-phosphate reductoisomerase
MIHAISILGSTGSVGRQTIAVAQRLGIRILALTANSNAKLLEEQARLLHPAFVALYDETAANMLRFALADTDIRVGSGLSGLIEAAVLEEAEAVITAVSGSVGLRPTLAAIEQGKRIGLANKETLVCAGAIVMQKARVSGAEIVPVDSEHSAIFQCLSAGQPREIQKLLLTASGGTFHGRSRAELENVTPEQAVCHPNWNMGVKISIDSSTMMNKGLEFIEAMHLFDVRPDDIEVLIHPESIVHSMVAFQDGVVVAQLGVPDMGLPIQYALTYPERHPSHVSAPDFATLAKLTFERPNLDHTPCLRLAMDCARAGGTAPAVMNAANEEAVALFLRHQIGYNQIYDCVAEAVQRIKIVQNPDLACILAADQEARQLINRNYCK